MSLTNQRYHTHSVVVSAAGRRLCARSACEERGVWLVDLPPCGTGGGCLRLDRAPTATTRFKVAALPSPCPSGRGSARPPRGRSPAFVNHPDPLRRRTEKCSDSPSQDDSPANPSSA